MPLLLPPHTPRPQSDSNDICHYIANDSMEAADRVVDSLELLSVDA